MSESKPDLEPVATTQEQTTISGQELGVPAEASLHPDDETLVAYLDDELTTVQRQSVEQRLVDDEVFRGRLQSLQMGWDMLDVLPTPTPDERTVQSTLELVIEDLASAFPDVAKTTALPNVIAERANRKLRRSRVNWLFGTMAALLVLFAGGFAFQRIRDRQRQVNHIADLAVAIDTDAYLLADQRELIEFLMDQPTWRTLVPVSPVPDAEALTSPGGENSLYPDADLRAAAEGNQEAIIAAIDALDSKQYTYVGQQWEKFDKLSPENQLSLRASAESLRKQPNSAEVLQTLREYARWRQALPSDLVERLESASADERQGVLYEALRESAMRVSQESSRNLTDEAVERIDFAVREIVRGRISGPDTRYRDIFTGVSNRGYSEEKALRIMSYFIMPDSGWDRTWHNSRPSRDRGWVGNEDRPPRGNGPEMGPGPPGFPPMGGRERSRKFFSDRLKLEPFSSDDLALIKSMLPYDDFQTLEIISSESEFFGTMILQNWIRESIRRKRDWGFGSNSSLRSVYESMPDSQRDVIDLLPPDEAIDRLLDERTQ